MRLFFALWPDPQVRAQFAHWTRELHRVCGGRAIRPANLHLTLAFLGDLDAAGLAQVELAAGEVAPPACTLVFDQPGYWKHNRIAWAGASGVAAELQTFVTQLRSALTRANVDFDAKDHVPHLTLLREAHAPRDMPALPAIVWRVDAFALVQSVVLAHGNRYEIRRSWKR